MIDEKCSQWYCAREQRKTELQRGDGLSGSMGYEVAGCYICNGYNTKCRGYLPKEDKN